MGKNLENIEEFWNANLCGKHFISAKYPSKEFFEQYRTFRYKKAHHLDSYIDWESASGKNVLEIGLGVGADGTRWAKTAKNYTGVDLTNEAVVATREHLEKLGLKGTIVQGNSESLAFQDNSFDIVYSHGVLHHTVNIDQALKEVHKVLRADGQFILMLYSKSSFNYWIRIQLYFRLRFLIELLKSKVGIEIPDPWYEHQQNLLSKGWSYFSWNEWPHHCTDGPECDIANIYTKRAIRKMLDNAGFKIVQMKKAHFPVGLSPKLEQLLAKYIGFQQFVWAVKKSSNDD